MWLELTISPSTSSSGATRVSNRPSARRQAASPCARLPKWKFSPTLTWVAPSRPTSTSSMNCWALRPAKSRSNGMTTSSSHAERLDELAPCARAS